MNKTTLVGSLLLIPAMFLFVAVGCSNKKKDEEPEDGPAKKKNVSSGKSKTREEIKTPMTGTITGVVKLKGKAPERPVIAALPAHADSKTCLMGEKVEQTWHVDNDGHVADAIVFLAVPKTHRFPDAAKDKVPGIVYLDQPYCQYVPHVVGVCGPSQKLVAKNSAAVSHNVKIDGGGEVGNFNFNLSPKPKDGPATETDKVDLAPAGNEQLIPASCSIHSWMNARIAVFNHPYFCRTDEKGAFKIENVPIDFELTVYLWHESMGNDLSKKADQGKKKFTAGDNSLGVLTVGQ
jgi:hypothetical protein